MAEDYKEIQAAVESILNVKTHVKRKKRNQTEKRMELFVNVISRLEEIIVRSQIMSVDMQLDFFEYDEKFMQVIDALFYINFGQSGSDLISYYLYERINEDGSINPIIDKNGTEVYIETPYQLWNVLNDMKVHDQ
jgi:hypothetical protein